MASTPTRLKIPDDAREQHKCLSQKRCYPTYADALDAAERLMEMDRVDPGCHQTPYKCNDCHTWHVACRRIVSVR